MTYSYKNNCGAGFFVFFGFFWEARVWTMFGYDFMERYFEVYLRAGKETGKKYVWAN